MPTVEVSFTPLPAHVRTARLVALAVARRAGVPDEALDEVRLAVGEACSRAVGIHASRAPGSPVVMRLSDDTDRFCVEVQDVGTAKDTPPAAGEVGPELMGEPGSGPPDEESGTDILPPEFGLAVITGLVDDLEVTSDADGTSV